MDVSLYESPIFLFMDQADIGDQVKKNNRKKLLQQNTKLFHELKRLQAEIQALQDQQEHQSQPQAPQNDQFARLKAEIESQQREIKRLKQLIEAGRHTNIKENVLYIRKEEDDLICLKKQLQTLLQEKEVVTNAHQDKLKKLSQNQPLQRHKEQMQSTWAETKKQNRQLNLKLVEMQRQIRKFHSIKQRAKAKTDNAVDQEAELTQIEFEIDKMNQESESKSLKWKPNIDQLDKDFFSLKNHLAKLQEQQLEVEREENIWKMRAAALRNQTDIQNDRARLSKIVSIVPPPEPAKPTVTRHRYQLSSSNIKARKSIVENIKQHNLSLPRAESTQNPPTIAKISQPIRQIREDLQTGNQRLKKSNRSQQRSYDSSQHRPTDAAQIPKMNPSIKKTVGLAVMPDLKEIKSSSRNIGKPQITDTPKGPSNYVGVRDKHRIKSSAAVNLSEEIKKKTNEVKEINKTLLGQVKRSPLKNKHQQSSTKLQKEPKGIKASINKSRQIQTNEVLSPKLHKDKSTKGVNLANPAGTDSKGEFNKQHRRAIRETHQGIASKQKVVKQQKISKQKKVDRQLVEKVTIRDKDQKKDVASGKIKQRGKDNSNQQQIHKPKKNNPVFSGHKQGQVQTYPQSPKASPKKQKSKPEAEIKPSPPKTVSVPQPKPEESLKGIAVELIDETEGIPKIVKRKRVAEGALVTTGTST